MPAMVPSILQLSCGRPLIYVLFPSPRNRVGKDSTLFCVSLTQTARTGIGKAADFFPLAKEGRRCDCSEYKWLYSLLSSILSCREHSWPLPRNSRATGEFSCRFGR